MAKEPAWLTEAARHIGYHETPVNLTPFGDHYHLNGEPWCACFVSYCLWKSGHPLPSMQPGMSDGFAAVVYGMNYAKQRGCWRPSTDAEPGDIIVYGWAGPGSTPENMHTGFVVSSGPVGSLGHTIEGNRGDQVERQTFTVGETVVLGTIDVKKLLRIDAGVKKPAKKPAAKKPSAKKSAPSKSPAPASKPAPQPRHPDHPTDTGPTKAQRAEEAKRFNALIRAYQRWLNFWKNLGGNK